MPDAQFAAVAPSGLNTFGEFLKFLRRRAQLTQAELAIACGYSPPHISHLENNQRFPDQSTLLALFVPGLGLQDEPELVERLLTLAANARQAASASVEPGQGTTLPRHNLPVASTPFVGREDELARIEQLLGDPGCRLLTLTGPGGIGKTRLALQAATRQLSAFADGVFFVSLAGVRSPELIIPTIADALGFSFRTPLQSGAMTGDPFASSESSVVEDTGTQLLSYLRGKRLLLVMDNCEHLLDGLALLPEILSNTPGGKILATSREPLGLQEEWVVALQGLGFPQEVTETTLETYSAVQLFMQRARQVQANFSLAENAEAVVRICQQVEGLPLSIELAVGLLRAVPIAEIADQIGHNLDLLTSTLRDVPERHRSLRAVFEQSWSLLSEVERTALMRLSVFRGGFRRDAASYVTEAPFRVLLALVDKSLVRLSPSGRYDIHELLRQFAEEQLRELPRESEVAPDRHCAYFAQFVCQRQVPLEVHLDRTAIEEMQADIENVRTAWSRAVNTADTTQMGLLLRGFHIFFVLRGWLEEGLATFANAARMLRHASLDAEGSLVFGQILTRQAIFELLLHRGSRAGEALMYESLSIVQRLNAPWDTAYAMKFLGIAAAEQQHVANAREYFAKAGEMFRTVGATNQVVDCAVKSGKAAQAEGQVEEALTFFREALTSARESGSTWVLADALDSLGEVSWRLGRYPEAREYYQESLALRRSMGSYRFLSGTLTALAWVMWLQGEYSEARQSASEAVQISREWGLRAEASFALFNLALAESGLGEHRRAVEIFHEVVSVGRELNNEALVGIGLSGLAGEYWLLGDFVEAKQSAQECLAVFQDMGWKVEVAGTLDTLGHATESLGDHEGARGLFLEGLRINLEMGGLGVENGLFSVGGMAKVLAAEGQTERALELLGLVLSHPGARVDLPQYVQPLLTELEAELPPEVVAAGLERGKALDLETTIRELLEKGMPIDAHSEAGERGSVEESDPPPDTPEV